MFSISPSYKCPAGNTSDRVCLDLACRQFCFMCPTATCQQCINRHQGHEPNMALSMFLLEVLQRPSIDPELLESYEKLMHLLENDPTLEYMCE
jgi:hypothetical protein